MADRKYAVWEPVSIAFLGYSDDGEAITHGRNGKELEMSDLIRTEQYKLFASLMNTFAGAIVTVGVFTPLAVTIYGIGEPPKNSDLFNGLPFICMGIALGLHIVGQLALARLETGDDE